MRIFEKATMLILVNYVGFILASCSDGQQAQNSYPLSDFEFKSIFGTHKNDKHTSFCLLGQGFFRAPSSSNSDTLLNDWMKSHSKSMVVPVSSFGPTVTDDQKSQMKYCWVIDGNDTLNNYLVRNGCFPGGTMQVPQFIPGGKSTIKMFMNDKSYLQFIAQIKVAETFAREHKLGIWSKNENEEK
jgi:hypothetical protein